MQKATKWTAIGFIAALGIATSAIAALGAIGTDKSSSIVLSHSQIIRVYDGDTFFVNLPGLPSVFGSNLGVRILGIDTPELRSKCKTEDERVHEKKLALDAKDSLTSQLNDAKVIELTALKRDKYFRLLAKVNVDGKDVSETLIEQGHARAYDGGTKVDWCR